MNANQTHFRDRLLEAERPDPDYKARYEAEIKAMIEQKLTTPSRWAWGGAVVLGLSFTGIFGAVAIRSAGDLPLLARAGFALGAVFGLAAAGMAAWILKRGTINLKSHPTSFAGMAWGFTILVVVLLMHLARSVDDPIKGVQMVLNGLVFLVIAALFMIFNRIDQAQLKTREKLLEIEYRLAEMSEADKEKN